ncbi:MAG: hypothetical protein IT490_06565, partial [Candidatus Contendobacter sp.]|nr:hypothetical protein [Candidatus Contendobacter sp.]
MVLVDITCDPDIHALAKKVIERISEPFDLN